MTSDTIAMHMSDGIINAPISAMFGLVAAAGLGYSLFRARAGRSADLDDRTAPMAGLVAAFIFAVQMINFPVLPGVSGHLLGGALAAILVFLVIRRVEAHNAEKRRRMAARRDAPPG